MPESNEPVAEAPVETQPVEVSAPPVSQEPPSAPADPPADPEPAESVPEPTEPQDAPEPEVVYAPRPVTVDNRTTRGDDDVQLGHWADVVSGQHAGRYGAYVDTVDYDPQTGYPRRVHLRTRDARNEILEVEYSDLRPADRTGSR